MGNIAFPDNGKIIVSGTISPTFINESVLGEYRISNRYVHTGDQMNFYEVFVIDNNDGSFIDGPSYVVAKDIESAKFKANVYGLVADYGYELDDVTIIVSSKGTVNLKKKEGQ